MSMEPDYLAQNGEALDGEQARAWFAERAGEAKARGMCWARMSVHPAIKHLRLVEGWKERPKSEGEPRFMLEASGPQAIEK